MFSKCNYVGNIVNSFQMPNIIYEIHVIIIICVVYIMMKVNLMNQFDVINLKFENNNVKI